MHYKPEKNHIQKNYKCKSSQEDEVVVKIKPVNWKWLEEKKKKKYNKTDADNDL